MSLNSRVKALVKVAALRAGYEIRQVEAGSTMDGALQRLAVRELGIRTIVDIGASDGRWSLNARSHFPEATLLLVEALEEPHGSGLDRMRQLQNTHVVVAAAGDHAGSIHFDASDPFGGAASTMPTGDSDVVVPMTTIDLEVERLGLAGPFLLKFDTHGFELPILEGAAATIQQTTVIVMESYNFELQSGSLTFVDMCRHLAEQGFRVADLVDVMRRPGDQILWQFDLVFARKDRPEFGSNTYA